MAEAILLEAPIPHDLTDVDDGMSDELNQEEYAHSERPSTALSKGEVQVDGELRSRIELRSRGTDGTAEGDLEQSDERPTLDEMILQSVTEELKNSESKAADHVEKKPLEDPVSSTTDIHEKNYQEEMERRKQTLKQTLLDQTKAPVSYYTNNKKENLVLEYVDNFNRQYVQLYPGRKELFLSPPNEFGIKKFACTTIRPTALPYKELYDYRSCAKFIADYMNYEPLDPPHEAPKMLASPTYTLKLQSGNSFDFSVLLVSLLRGVGYDAYVVTGYASREITLKDESHVESDAIGLPPPYDPSTEDEEIARAAEPVSKVKQDKYKIKTQRQLKSQFLTKQEMKKKLTQEKVLKEQQEREAKERDLADVDEDELKGLRVHAWVLVLPGRRDIAEPFFIEPSTGRIYETTNDNFLGVESVFSSRNFWVNMQLCYDGLKSVSFDLADNSKWEFVMLNKQQPAYASREHERQEEDDDEEEEGGSEILDLPPSWVEKLVLTTEQFESKCPLGSRTVLYRNARLEIFAEYHRQDGMVTRITYFADDKKGFPGQIREFFENRKDRLRERVRIPALQQIHEFFNPGRSHSLRKHIIDSGKTKEMHFYANARSDGLIKRIEQPTKTIEYFTDRDDGMIYRSVTFDRDRSDEVHRQTVKMTEKFGKRSDKIGSDDVAKRTYLPKQDKIKLVYHLPPGRIIPSTREFRKPSSDLKVINYNDISSGFEVDSLLPVPKKQNLYAQLLKLMKAEQSCIAAVKTADREVKEILLSRQTEEKDISLYISVYDTVRNNTKIPTEEEKEAVKAEAEEKKAAELDYLSPFLVNVRDVNAMTREEALAVKDACLKSLKERLIEKANIIQTKLDEITGEYQRRQLIYSRNVDTMTSDETEEYVKFCNDALFKIHILEKRLAKHKEQAPIKYMEMDTKLRNDSRLNFS